MHIKNFMANFESPESFLCVDNRKGEEERKGAQPIYLGLQVESVEPSPIKGMTLFLQTQLVDITTEKRGLVVLELYFGGVKYKTDVWTCQMLI